MANPPPGQGELGADQHMDQEEEDQIKVELGVQVLGLAKGHYDPVGPGIAGDQEDNHEDKETPCADPIYLDKQLIEIHGI
jgi:hypothetical protein